MSIVEFHRLPSWSLDVSETGESTKRLWVVAVGLTFFHPLCPPPPPPTGILYSSQFHLHQETKIAAVKLNDRYLRLHGKIGDCEQSHRLYICNQYLTIVF